MDGGMETLLALAGFSTANALFSWVIQKHRDGQRILVGKVSDLYLWPVKSCGGIRLENADCTWQGLYKDGVTDRHWLVLSETGQFITLRQEPRMSLIKTSIQGRHLQLNAAGMPSLLVPLDIKIDANNVKKLRIWNLIREGVDCGDEAASWLSKFLGRDVRLLHGKEGLQKTSMVNDHEFGNRARAHDQVFYHDFSTFNMVSTSSFNDLNNRLKDLDKVDNRSFRANILVETDGCPPFTEDTWERVFVGDTLVFTRLKLCDRCLLTTVIADKGEKHPDQQPLKTLKSYRLKEELGYGKSPIFGINIGIDRCGLIRVGDPVYAVLSEPTYARNR